MEKNKLEDAFLLLKHATIEGNMTKEEYWKTVSECKFTLGQQEAELLAEISLAVNPLLEKLDRHKKQAGEFNNLSSLVRSGLVNEPSIDSSTKEHLYKCEPITTVLNIALGKVINT